MDDWTKTGTAVNYLHTNRSAPIGRLTATVPSPMVEDCPLQRSPYSNLRWMWIPVGDSENRGCSDSVKVVGKTHEKSMEQAWLGNGRFSSQRTLAWMNTPKGPGSETLSRQLKEDSSTGLHGITNGGTVLITGKIGQTYTASTHVKLESGGRTGYVGIGQDETVRNWVLSIKSLILLAAL